MQIHTSLINNKETKLMVTLRYLAISRKKVKIKTYSDPRIFHILTLQLQDKGNGNAVSGRRCIHNCVLVTIIRAVEIV